MCWCMIGQNVLWSLKVLFLVIFCICGNFQIGMFVIDLDDDYFDMLQEEFCSVVEVFGVSLEKGWYDQLFIVFCVLLLSCKNLFGDIKLDGMV